MSDFEHKQCTFSHSYCTISNTAEWSPSIAIAMTTAPRKILIVDDDPDILTASKLLLKRHADEIISCSNPAEIASLQREHSFSAILLDMNFSPGDSSGSEGIYWLKQILKQEPDAVVVMVTAHGDVDLAVEAMKHGAIDFVSKPWQNEKLVATLSSAMRLSESRNEARMLMLSNKALSSASNAPQAMLGNSLAMQHVMGVIARAAPTEANVLILGENGTGKELAAKEIHARSTRADQVFMSVDLGAISENLFESELFGHSKGAFSGAQQERVGRLLAANKGTLFLDEIGNIPLALQAKLLTVLEQRKVVPVGSNTAVPFDVRVVAATNVEKNELYQGGNFREDLLFRLNTVEITLPPLRERSEDVATLCDYYADMYAHKYRKPPRMLSVEAVEVATHYSWPGNIRALRHAIERAVILSDGAQLETVDLQIEGQFVTGSAPSHANQTAEVALSDSKELNLERLEKNAIANALKQHSYNISKSAKALGLTRAALYRRMEKHGL